MASKETTNAQKAARHLDNLAVQFNDAADQNRSAAKLLSAAANVVRKQDAENQALRDEVAALKAAAAESDAKVKSSADLLKKLLTRTHEIARADKSASITASSAVRGSLDTAVTILNQMTADTAEPAATPAVNEQEKTKVAEITQKTEKTPAKERDRNPLALLIDGSASAVLSSLNGEPSVLKRSLEATAQIARDGANLSVALWGSEKVVPVSVTKEGLEKAAGGLNTITDFSSVLNHMNDSQSRHFAIISDGDLGAGSIKGLLAKTREFLAANPRATIDFVVVNDLKGTDAEKFARTLVYEAPVQVTLRAIRKEDRVLSALREIADRRGSLRMSPDVRIMNTYYKKPGLKK